MILSNGKMNMYLNILNTISNKVKGKLAYAIARNIRKISNELIEFENIKNDYIIKNGKRDENGNIIIKNNTEEYNQFLFFIDEYINIEHEVDIYMVSEEDFYNSDLTANEILELDFMIKDTDS